VKTTPLGKPVRRQVLFMGTLWIVTLDQRGVILRVKGQRRRWITTYDRLHFLSTIQRQGDAAR
jgi:hypothetical protein